MTIYLSIYPSLFLSLDIITHTYLYTHVTCTYIYILYIYTHTSTYIYIKYIYVCTQYIYTYNSSVWDAAAAQDAFFLQGPDPIGREEFCPRDGRPGCAMVDVLERVHRRQCHLAPGDFMLISWWFHGDFMVVSWWFNGDFMVVEWWFNGDFMVV
jgi:hypothetical protein